jgi:tRNA (cmo5U34)-methyltransferase
MEHPILEPMGDFFDRRAADYEEHQIRFVDGGDRMYPFTASLLPDRPGAEILDLGCGSGLELDAYFPINPTAVVTGVDLSRELTDLLLKKHADRAVQVILGSYFDEEFGEGIYDAAVSVMSLHHFTAARKIPLYQKVKAALKPDGFFVLTDYFAPDEEWESRCFSEYERLKRESGLPDGVFYHYDTPLTLAHETDALLAAGFSEILPRAKWGNTVVLTAK